MKLQPLSRQPWLTLSLAVGLSLCLPGAAPAATLSVSPSTISNSFAGYITLTIGGLTNGETVVVQKFADANTNGVIDAPDILWQQFQLKDGEASVIGGVTNINVPGDTDATAGQITARLAFPSIDFSQSLLGRYAFKLSSPGGHFAPLTNLFTITNFPYLQTMTGAVVNSGTNVPNAIVILFYAPSPSQDGPGYPLGGAMADNSGNYAIKAPTGRYLLLAFKTNFVVNTATAPVVALGSGATVSTNLTLINADQSISGKIADAADNSIGLPGLLLHAEANGVIAVGFSDTNGNFTMRVGSGEWDLGSEGLAAHGYLAFDSGVLVNTTTGDVSGLVIGYSKITALFYGSVKDDQNRPIAGVGINSYDTNYQYYYDALTDTNGNYVGGALGGGAWSVNVSSEARPGLSSYVFSDGLYGANLSVGQAVPYNFTGILATNQITGHLQDNVGGPISGVGVFGFANINGTNYQSSNADTDGNGNYTLNVPNGTWYVGVNCCDDCDNGLGTSYCCPQYQIVNISNANGVANFTAAQAGTVAIATDSPLPAANVGSYYEIQFNASSCQPPFTWTNSPGSPSLPSGLDLDPNGTLSGTPDTLGSNYFSVRVTDNASHIADKGFSLIVQPPALEVTTLSLTDGTNGTFYSNIVEAVGGQLPYSWSLAPGSASLPPNLSISTNGLISGTLATNGTFYFYVRVTDALSSNADSGELSLTIDNPPSPSLQITNSSLPNGLEGAAYNAQLGATGGQMPYTWSLAPGSSNLPANLSIGADGLISGTPITNGTFNFIVRVTDAVPAFTNRMLGIIINPKPRLSALLVSNQFKLRLTGATGLNYTVQYSTRLTNPIWTSFLVTNPSTSPITLLDLNATNLSPYPTNLDLNGTNPVRFYRAIVGP